jgi:hypothetical protein
VEVVKDEDQRQGLREMLQQRPHRTVAAVALVLGRYLVAASQRRQRRENVRELSLDSVTEYGEPARLQARDVLIQRIDEHRERQVVLELRRRPGQNQMPARPGASGELPQQPGLADPRFARHLNRARTASIQLVEDPLERSKLVGPPHEVPGKQRHTLLFRTLKRHWGA